MKLLDVDHPFFRPIWRRVAVVVVCIGWGLFEFSTGQAFWGIIFCGLGAYVGYLFSRMPTTDARSDVGDAD